jgi:MYXO-CTERM domain-containing protein
MLLLGLYLAVTLVLTHPLVWQLGTAMPGIPGDQTEYMWCVDTFWASVLAGQNPFTTNRVLYPVGANLMHTGFAPFVSLFAWPFLGHLPLYLSLVVLVSYPAAAVAMFLLVRALTGNAGAAAIAGLLYGFGPPLVSFAEASHYYKVVAAALLPYGALSLVRFLDAGRLRPLLGLSAVTWALVFTDYYVLVMHLLAVAIVGIVCLRARHVRGVVIAAIANAVLAIALIRWVFPPLDTSDLWGGGYGVTSRANANLADFLVPRVENPLLGRLGVWATDRPNGDVDYFLGWGTLALALSGVWRRRRSPLIVGLAAAGLILLVLACGPAIRFGHRELLTHAWTLWHWLAKLPSLNILDLPRPFALGAALSVTALAGVGLATWRRPRLAVVLGAVLFAVEYGQIGMRLSTFPVPAIYQRLAAKPGTRTLLELPSGITESKGGPSLNLGINYSNIQNNPQMYWQTVHRKPRVGAYLSRIPRSTYQWFAEQPVISDLFIVTSTGNEWNGRKVEALPSYPPEVVDRFLRTFNLGYVILQPHPQQAEFARTVEALLAGRIAAREADAAGYVLYTLVQ